MASSLIYKLTVRTIFVMIVGVSILQVFKCDSFSIDTTLSNSSHLNSRSSNNSTVQSSLGSQSYANHRMDIDSLSDRNITLQIDREAAGSVLRPQLALQIYTNPSQDDKPVNKQRESTGAMLIVPMHQPRNQADSHQTSSSQNRQQHPRSSSLNKVNPWHYVTDQSSYGSEGTGNHGDTISTTPLLQRSNPGPPLINAIITVPTPNEHHHHHHHQQSPAQYNHRHDKHQQSSTNTYHQEDNSHNLSSLERSVSRLMDSQADGSLEFTMNLNGEQITINPVSNKARILNMINKDKANPDEQLDQVIDNDETVARRFMNEAGLAAKDSHQMDKQSTNRAIRTHVDSELVGDQQSASEIDLVDGANEEENSNSEVDFDRPVAKEEDKTRPLREGPDSTELSDKEDRVHGRRSWRASEQNQNDENERTSSDEQFTDETHNEGKVLTRKDLDSEDDDKRTRSSKHYSSSGKEGKGYPRSQQVNHSSRSRQRKATSGSKRRSTYKDDDYNQEERAVESNSRREKNQDVPAVLIKGEDVRRFEQLLENLRSISLNNQVRSKRTGKASKAGQVVQRNQPPAALVDQSDDEDLGYGNQKNEDSSTPVSATKSWSINGLPSKSSSARSHASSKISASSESDDTTDCDRRRQQQQLHKAATTNNEDIVTNYVPETSSLNIVDQDTIASNDGEDLVSDDASGQAAEQEEQSSNNHNKISLPLAETTKDLVEASSQTALQPESQHATQSPQQLSQPDEQDQEKPRALFVRKTILQNYYDSNGNHVTVQGNQPADELKSIHKSQHETLHERHMAANGMSSQNSPDTAVYRRLDGSKYQQEPAQPVSGPQNAENSQASYIDYNQLDDREIHKGSESRKIRTIVRPKKLPTQLSIRPLHNLLEKSVERPRAKIIQVKSLK